MSYSRSKLGGVAVAVLTCAWLASAGRTVAQAQAPSDVAAQRDEPTQGDDPAQRDEPTQGDDPAQRDEPTQGDDPAQRDEPTQGSETTAAEDEPDDGSFSLPLFGRTTFSMTSTTTARYRGDNYDANPYDDDFTSLAQRFDLALQGEELRAELRLDAFAPSTSLASSRCPAGSESLCYLSFDVRPERMTLRWEPGSWIIDAGDSQVVLGRGIAFSFRKVDLVGVDNALRGAHVRYEGERLRARIHVGVANPQNQDPISLGIIQDPGDVLTAASLGTTLFDDTPLKLDAHYVRVWFANDSGDAFQQRRVDVVGWSADAPALADGDLSIYVEANALRRTSELFGHAADPSYGRAVYAAVQGQSGDLTLLVEWKDYRDYLVAASSLEANPWRIYSAAPTLEYDGPQRLRAIGNQRGGSIRADYAFSPGPWSGSLNASVYGLGETMATDPWRGILVTHGWVTISRHEVDDEDPTWSLELAAGYRRETYIDDPRPMDHVLDAGDLDRQTAHAKLDATLGSGTHSLEASLDHRYETERTFDGGTRGFHVGGVSTTYAWKSKLALSLGLRWSDFDRGQLDARAAEAYNVLGGLFYPSLEARWNFDAGTYVKAFVGSTPGGQICSGGVCRQVPPFEGLLLQLVGRL